MAELQRRARRIDAVACLILVLAVVVRLYRIDAPFVDAHSWRQVTNADIARHWTEGPIDFFYPRVSWGGPDGRVGLEFPLLHLLMALVWRVTGESATTGRLVPAAFSVLSVWFTYRLGTRLFDRTAGRVAALVMALSPSLVYFGRTPLSDTPMVCFSVAAVLGYVAYVQSGWWAHALGGALALALAGLVKVPAILVLGPVLWTGLVMRGLKGTLRDPWFVSAPLAAIGAIGLWYLHADLVYQETGLTQAIFRPSGTYPIDLAQFAGTFTTVSHWTRKDLLAWPTFAELGWRYWNLHLTPVFAVLALAGVCAWRWPWRARSVVDIWMAAGLSLVLVSLAGQVPHEFHQLPTLPPLALYAGLGAATVLGWLAPANAPLWRRRAAGAGAVLGLPAAALVGFLDSGVIRHLYRPDNLNLQLIDAGADIDAVTPKSALVATVEYDRYGSNSPMLLYYAHRNGWSFDAVSITPMAVEYLRGRYGLCHVAVTDWGLLESLRPDMTTWLRRRREVPLPYAFWRYKLFDVGCPP